MDKSQVRSCINKTFPIGYNPLTGNVFIDTTGATLNDVLAYTSSGVVWQAPTSGSAAWGGITGTLSAQTDLQAALDAKFGELVATYSPSGAASVTIPVDGAYRGYYIRYYDLFPATNSASFRLRVGTTGSYTIDTGSNYGWIYGYTQGNTGTGGAVGFGTNFTDSAIYFINNTLSNNSNRPCSGWIYVENPSQSSTYHNIEAELNCQNDSAALITKTSITGIYKSTTAVTAIQLYMHNGNMTGTIDVYGVK